MDPLRPRLSDSLKSALKAGDAPRLSAIRMIVAKVKDADIAARPNPPLADDALMPALRAMVKSRRDAIALYEQGGRRELADKERAEIAVIEEFLPRQDEGALAASVERAIAETGAAAPRDMGRVMAALKAAHGGALDMAAASALVKERLG